ncbi:hypothetical protein G9A89_007971 [Geosiphon pyriformis]|nr:hypothetical protein G9A89_007971 [Geosiphon pyriformis]
MVISEPIAQDPLQQNILIALQSIQTALGGDVQNPIKWLDDFERAATANQYDNKYKFQIKPIPMLIKKSLDGHWQMLEKTIFLSLSVVTEYAKAIKKLIKHVDSGRNWTEEQKIHSFTKGLKTDLSYAFWPLLALKDNPTMDMAIELNAFGIYTSSLHSCSYFDPNGQLIDRLTANLAWLLEPLAQAPCFNQPQQLPYQKQQNRGPPVCYHCELTGHFSRDCNNFSLPLPVPRNNNNQNNRPINNNAPNQRPNHANINFFGEDPLVKATSESTSQTEENPFFTFNLTDNNHYIDELAINTLESIRKKKKAKIDFILDLNKAFTSTADNNEPPKAKVFKNSPKLELPEIVQKSGSYSVVKDLMETPAHITFGQLITHPQFRKNLCKSLILKKKTPKTNKCPHQAGLADNSNVTLLICKAQVAGYFIDLILDSRSSVSIIAKHFLKAIGRKIDEPST